MWSAQLYLADETKNKKYKEKKLKQTNANAHLVNGKSPRCVKAVFMEPERLWRKGFVKGWAQWNFMIIGLVSNTVILIFVNRNRNIAPNFYSFVNTEIKVEEQKETKVQLCGAVV